MHITEFTFDSFVLIQDPPNIIMSTINNTKKMRGYYGHLFQIVEDEVNCTLVARYYIVDQNKVTQWAIVTYVVTIVLVWYLPYMALGLFIFYFILNRHHRHPIHKKKKKNHLLSFIPNENHSFTTCDWTKWTRFNRIGATKSCILTLHTIELEFFVAHKILT